MKSSFLITGIHCAGCINRIDSKLRSIGVEHFDYDFQSKVALLDFDKQNTDNKQIKEAIESLGYHAYLRGDY